MRAILSSRAGKVQQFQIWSRFGADGQLPGSFAMNFGVNLVDFTLDVVENAISNFREVQIWNCWAKSLVSVQK
jgi:hypothetical protein